MFDPLRTGRNGFAVTSAINRAGPVRSAPLELRLSGDIHESLNELVRSGYRYGAILIDCPFEFRTRTPEGGARSPSSHYRCMSLEQLRKLPIRQLLAKDGAVFMWVPDPFIPLALALVEAWGLAYKTVAFQWVKTLRRTEGFAFGLGYYTRGNVEQCWLLSPGTPRVLHRDVPKLILAPRREHSRKPPEARWRIERLVRGPYLEIFARETADGWHSVGDQAGCLGHCRRPPRSRAS
jgi:N6-adenosine-specific RNA methylase IME4